MLQRRANQPTNKLLIKLNVGCPAYFYGRVQVTDFSLGMVFRGLCWRWNVTFDGFNTINTSSMIYFSSQFSPEVGQEFADTVNKCLSYSDDESAVR